MEPLQISLVLGRAQNSWFYKTEIQVDAGMMQENKFTLCPSVSSYQRSCPFQEAQQAGDAKDIWPM